MKIFMSYASLFVKRYDYDVDILGYWPGMGVFYLLFLYLLILSYIELVIRLTFISSRVQRINIMN